MQLIIIVEFLIPGLAIVLLSMPHLSARGSFALATYLFGTSDAIAALFLLAISYPVGILANFPIYFLLQRWGITPIARRMIMASYLEIGIDLSDLVRERFGIELAANHGKQSPVRLKQLFGFMQVAAFKENIDRLNTSHRYYQGLQRLARGMLLPLLLGMWNLNHAHAIHVWGLVTLGGFVVVALCLLGHSVWVEEEQVARYFFVSCVEPRHDFEVSDPCAALGSDIGEGS